MIYCEDCAKRYGFPPPQRLALSGLSCNICCADAVPVGAVRMRDTPLRERLEVANRVQAIINKVYQYEDVKPLIAEFLDRVEVVMARELEQESAPARYG